MLQSAYDVQSNDQKCHIITVTSAYYSAQLIDANAQSVDTAHNEPLIDYNIDTIAPYNKRPANGTLNATFVESVMQIQQFKNKCRNWLKFNILAESFISSVLNISRS